jgi:hypothetical protein
MKFPNQDDFQRAYTMAYAKAQVAKDLISFLSKQDSEMAIIRKQINAPEKNYVVG